MNKQKNSSAAKKRFIVLKSGKEVAFWRQGTHDSWKFSGTEQELAEAQKQASVYGEYLKAAGEGTITYRSRIFQIKQNGDDIIITINSIYRGFV